MPIFAQIEQTIWYFMKFSNLVYTFCQMKQSLKICLHLAFLRGGLFLKLLMAKFVILILIGLGNPD
jgi:hypothetical protein